MSQPERAYRARASRGQFRTLVAVSLLCILWTLMLKQSLEISWAFTEHPFPPERVERYTPLRNSLHGVSQADLFAGFEETKQRRRVFWRAQFALAPTVLKQRNTPAAALNWTGNKDPHHLVVEFPSHEEFLRFRRRYERLATQNDRIVWIQDLENGIGVLVSLGRGG